MKDYLSLCPKKLLASVKIIGRLADQMEAEAYLVGGIVRDLILKRGNLDLDIVILGDAILLARQAAVKIKGRLTVYKPFGTATISLPSGLTIDLATARKETYAKLGALPVVRRGTFKEDLFRRDFTVNAMALSINRDSWGRLVDPFGGKEDLGAGRIRVFHDKSFEDDPTRILRAVRFEQRFGFKIERHTLRLMKKAINRKGYLRVSSPRYFAEFRKILKEENPERPLKRLQQLRGLDFLLPRPQKISWVALDRAGTFRRKTKLDRRLADIPEGSLVYWMILLEGTKGSTLEKIMIQFPFKKREKDGLRQGEDARAALDSLSRGKWSRSDVSRRLRPLMPEVVVYMRARASRVKVRQWIDRYLICDRHVRTALQGKDLKAMGLPTGTGLGRILEKILYQKIDGKIKTKREELKLARKIIKSCHV